MFATVFSQTKSHTKTAVSVKYSDSGDLVSSASKNIWSLSDLICVLSSLILNFECDQVPTRNVSFIKVIRVRLLTLSKESTAWVSTTVHGSTAM